MPLEPAFYIRQGDTAPSITALLNDAAGAPIVLTGCTVRFRMTPLAGGPRKVDGAAVIVTLATAEVRYDWAPTGVDTDTPAYFAASWLITYPDGATTSVPNDDTPMLVLVTAAV